MPPLGHGLRGDVPRLRAGKGCAEGHRGGKAPQPLGTAIGHVEVGAARAGAARPGLSPQLGQRAEAAPFRAAGSGGTERLGYGAAGWVRPALPSQGAGLGTGASREGLEELCSAQREFLHF